MCFSVAIDKDIKMLLKKFRASQKGNDVDQLQKLFMQQDKMEQLKFEKLLGLPHSKKRPTVFRLPGEDNRVFPGYFANVIMMEEGERVLKPMRYRVRPSGSTEEIPDKFGVYNARIDSLETKKTWQPLFMRKHGLVPFTNFYEWVLDPEEKNDLGLFNFLDEDEKKELGDNPNARKRLISFFPSEREVMWAPCLWDEWVSLNGEISFKSFAIITNDPPKEVEIMGHDRCPIFFKEEYIDEWLNPQNSNVDEIYEILKQKENVKFSYKWA
ncbi:MAG: SOS response-associated peptidase [Bdellovibrionales bacterium]|nr:SOS response-associated peptidase [Bdellovibrionales bacterium]